MEPFLGRWFRDRAYRLFLFLMVVMSVLQIGSFFLAPAGVLKHSQEREMHCQVFMLPQKAKDFYWEWVHSADRVLQKYKHFLFANCCISPSEILICLDWWSVLFQSNTGSSSGLAS